MTSHDGRVGFIIGARCDLSLGENAGLRGEVAVDGDASFGFGLHDVIHAVRPEDASFEDVRIRAVAITFDGILVHMRFRSAGGSSTAALELNPKPLLQNIATIFWGWPRNHKCQKKC